MAGMTEEETYETKHRILEWYVAHQKIGKAYSVEHVAKKLNLPVDIAVLLCAEIYKDNHLTPAGTNQYTVSAQGAHCYIVLGGYKKIYQDRVQESLEQQADPASNPKAKAGMATDDLAWTRRGATADKAAKQARKTTNSGRRTTVAFSGILVIAAISLWVLYKPNQAYQVEEPPQKLESLCQNCQSLQPKLDSLIKETIPIQQPCKSGS